MEISEEEVIHLLQIFCEKMQLDIRNSDFVDRTSEKAPLARMCSRLQETICFWKEKINDMAHADVLCQMDEGTLSLLWGAVGCYSYMSTVDANPSLMVELMDAVDHLLTVKAGIPSFLYCLKYDFLVTNLVEPCPYAILKLVFHCVLTRLSLPS